MKIKWVAVAVCCGAVLGASGFAVDKLDFVGAFSGGTACESCELSIKKNVGNNEYASGGLNNDFSAMQIYDDFNALSAVVRNSADVGANEKLKAYLTELNAGNELQEGSFASLTTLTFDGSKSVTCNLIETIDGLANFNFNSVTKIEIKNMQNLTTADFNGLNGSLKVFPNLKTVVVANCPALIDLELDNNTKITTLDISECAELVLDLPQKMCSSLEILTLQGIRKQFSASLEFAKLKEFTLNNVAVVNLVVNGVVLEQAKIQNCSELISLTLSATELTDFTLQNNRALQSLDLTDCVNIKNVLLDEMDFEENGVIVSRSLVYAPNLKRVFADANDWFTEFDVSRSPNLETFVFTNCTNLASLSLPSDLSNLQTLNLTNCRSLRELDILSAVNLSTLSLGGCNLLKSAIFDNIDNYTNLQYLNLSETAVQAINFENFDDLQILFLGSDYLRSIALKSLPKLYQFEISSSSNLRQLTLENLPSLETFNPQYCDGVENISITNVSLSAFKISGKSKLKSVALSCQKLIELYIYDCMSLYAVEFSDCVNLKKIEIMGCSSLNSDSLESFENVNLLESVTVSECSGVYSFSLVNKPNLTMLNLKNLNSLTALTLSTLGQTPRIYLPSNMTGLRSLTLTNLMRAQFDGDVLDLANGVLSAVCLDNVPFMKIVLTDNMLSSVTISNVRYLQEIDLSNNKISNVDAIMTLLASSDQLSLVNLNNNRIDFSKGSDLKNLQTGVYANCVVLGLQNIINNNRYSYEPKIYYGGMGMHYPNIRAVLYYSNVNYKISEISDSKLKRFSRSNLVEDRFKTCKNGTYYVVFEKYDDNGKLVEMTDDEKVQFSPVYFTVSKEFDFVKFIWIIFVGVAGLIFIYVGISWFIERKRKLRLLGDDELGGDITDGGTKLTRKEIKIAEREHRRMFKENDKIDKQERKNKIIADKERLKLNKENEKEQRKIDAENAKLAKLVEKEHLKEEKEQQKAEKEQLKIEKERQKLKKSREKSIQADKRKDKTMKSPEEKAREKELKLEQKELKRLEKENLKMERLREKEEERELLGKNSISNIFGKRAEKTKTNEVDEEIEFPTMFEREEIVDEPIDDANALSDKDLNDILASRSPTKKAPPVPPKPKLPPRPKL